MTEDSGENDADKRPRMFGRVVSTEGEIEVTVQGGEGETSEDIEDRFHAAVCQLISAQDELPNEIEDERGFQ